MTSLPWHDWQFYVVTVAALWGAWRFLSPLLPRRPGAAAAPCGSCASGAAACARKPETAALTASPGPNAPLVKIGAGRPPGSAVPPPG